MQYQIFIFFYSDTPQKFHFESLIFNFDFTIKIFFQTSNFRSIDVKVWNLKSIKLDIGKFIKWRINRVKKKRKRQANVIT